MEIYKYLAANCRVRRNICLYVTIRKRWPKFYLYDKTAKRNGKWSTGLLLFFTEWLMVINLCPFIFNVDISQKTLIMKILARCQFCLLTSAACLSMLWWQSYTCFPVITTGAPSYVICDPWLGHCSLGILKRIPLWQIKRALKRHFFIQSFIY